MVSTCHLDINETRSCALQQLRMNMKLTQSIFVAFTFASMMNIVNCALRGGVVKKIGGVITGKVGQGGVDAVRNASFHTIDGEDTDFFKVNDFESFSPPGTPPDSPRGSFNLFPSISESPKKSNPTTPRNSETHAKFGNFISRISLGGSRPASPTSQGRTSSVPASPRNSSTMTPPRTGSSVAPIHDPSFTASQVVGSVHDDQLISRTASSNRPAYLSMFLNLHNVSDTDLTLLPAKRMSLEVEAMVAELSEIFGHFGPSSDYFMNLNRMLTYIDQKFILTPFVAHLAAGMLQHFGPKPQHVHAKAPKALELFLRTKMPFLAKTSKKNITESGELSFVDFAGYMTIKNVLADIDRSSRYSETLLKDLQMELSSCFLNILLKNSLIFDEVIMYYSIIFSNCDTLEKFKIRLATLVKLLIELTKKKISGPVTVSEIRTTLARDFKELSEYVCECYGIDD